MKHRFIATSRKFETFGKLQSFFSWKKAPIKATVKRYTLHLTMATMWNNGTSVASTIDALYITRTTCANMISKLRV
jgi:hypothetical protein